MTSFDSGPGREPASGSQPSQPPRAALDPALERILDYRDLTFVQATAPGDLLENLKANSSITVSGHPNRTMVVHGPIKIRISERSGNISEVSCAHGALIRGLEEYDGIQKYHGFEIEPLRFVADASNAPETSRVSFQCYGQVYHLQKEEVGLSAAYSVKRIESLATLQGIDLEPSTKAVLCKGEGFAKPYLPICVSVNPRWAHEDWMQRIERGFAPAGVSIAIPTFDPFDPFRSVSRYSGEIGDKKGLQAGTEAWLLRNCIVSSGSRDMGFRVNFQGDVLISRSQTGDDKAADYVLCATSNDRSFAISTTVPNFDRGGDGFKIGSFDLEFPICPPGGTIERLPKIVANGAEFWCAVAERFKLTLQAISFQAASSKFSHEEAALRRHGLTPDAGMPVGPISSEIANRLHAMGFGLALDGKRTSFSARDESSGIKFTFSADSLSATPSYKIAVDLPDANSKEALQNAGILLGGNDLYPPPETPRFPEFAPAPSSHSVPGRVCMGFNNPRAVVQFIEVALALSPQST